MAKLNNLDNIPAICKQTKLLKLGIQINLSIAWLNTYTNLSDPEPDRFIN